jgi:hypothetical protein
MSHNVETDGAGVDAALLGLNAEGGAARRMR